MLSVAGAAERGIERTERFDELFQRFYPQLFGLAYRLLGDQQETEDTLQEAFLKLAGARVREQPDEEVGAWLRRVVLNLGANRLRARRRAQARLERVGVLELALGAGPTDGPLSGLLQREAQAAVRRALAGVPERQRDCLLLRHSGYSYAEIAATLGVAVGSVGVLLARAERAFREVYREGDHDLP